MAKTDKPNILVIWGDDIGITNLSCYSSGLMGYRTPNIDRLVVDHVQPVSLLCPQRNQALLGRYEEQGAEGQS
jgi:arylsulfatase A-like enzyme